jgi:kynureninase
MIYEHGIEFAKKMDAADPLKGFRAKFDLPRDHHGNEAIYMCGNSLGPKPKALDAAIKEQFDGWAKFGVEGHWTPPCDWLPIHETVTKQLATVVGAKTTETVAMGTLTANLHHLMMSFYNPTPKRYKILYESNAFPSDRYAIASQIDMMAKKLAPFTDKGKDIFTADKAMIEIQPRAGEITLCTEDIEKILDEQGDEIALVIIGGNNFYTGQKFDMARITKKGHEKGCVVGFDLAHSVGNVELKLHDWNVDFACWCPYKYLNSGPGGIGAIFVHERHHADTSIPRLMGWWSNNPKTRFEMRHKIDAFQTAEAWQLSNPPVFSLIPVRVSLDIFMEAGMKNIFEKSRKLTGYMEFLLDSLNTDKFKIITPRDPERRGAQLSIVVRDNGKKVFDAMCAVGVIGDWRNPDCIRFAPAPLFNSFEDVYKCVDAFACELGLSGALKGKAA